MQIEPYSQASGIYDSRQRIPALASGFQEQLSMRREEAQRIKTQTRRIPDSQFGNSGIFSGYSKSAESKWNEGLKQTAVYPAALYQAYLNGERFMMDGDIQEGYEGCYTINPLTNELHFRSPGYGINGLGYDYWLAQNAFRSYNPYYSAEERQLQLQLMKNKECFLELAKELSVSKENGISNGLDILGTEAPDEVKEAWNKAEKEAGVNGMAMNSKGMLTQITKLFVMSLESKQSGDRQDILGSTVSSAKAAVQNALNRLGTPQNNEEKKEKLFYEAFLRYL